MTSSPVRSVSCCRYVSGIEYIMVIVIVLHWWCCSGQPVVHCAWTLVLRVAEDCCVSSHSVRVLFASAKSQLVMAILHHWDDSAYVHATNGIHHLNTSDVQNKAVGSIRCYRIRTHAFWMMNDASLSTSNLRDTDVVFTAKTLPYIYINLQDVTRCRQKLFSM